MTAEQRGGVVFVHERVVKFQEIDAAGIVFFAKVLEYMHDAFMAALADAGVDMPGAILRGPWGAPLVHAEADFEKPMRFGDPIAVELVRADAGTTALTVTWRVRDGRDAARTLARGKTVHAFIDRATFRPRAIPDEVLAALSATRADAATR